MSARTSIPNIGVRMGWGLACALLFAGCSTVVMQLEPQHVSKRLPFIQDGKTSKEEVLKRLGEPDRHYEGGRVLTYAMCGDTDLRDQWGFFSNPRPMNQNSEAARLAKRCEPRFPNTLILVFGVGDLVERHSLVEVK